MSAALMILGLHAITAAIAGLVYSLWTYKWLRRKQVLLGVLNLLLALSGYLFAAWFTFAILELPREVLRPGVTWAIPLLLLGPAVVRFFELQSFERSEAYARGVKRRLNGS